MKFILLALAVVALLGLMLAVRLVSRRNVMGWLLAWLKQDWRAPVPKGTTRHLLFLLAALFEIAGCYAFWMWLRLDRSALWIPRACSA